MSSVQNTKARHYAALAARLNTLKANLDETELLMDDMAGHLLAMRNLAASHAAQFMAMSRLVDLELIEHQQKQEAEAAAANGQQAQPQAQEPSGNESRSQQQYAYEDDREQRYDESYRTATP